MAYNSRMSIAPGSVNGKKNQRQIQDEADAFMTLSDEEIAGCIQDMHIQFNVSDLQRPNPQHIQRVFEWFAEVLMNCTRDVVAPAMRAAAEDLYGQDAERIFTSDTRDLMGFYVTLRRLLGECGINDFSFGDLYRPTHPRLVKIFSYIINFIRFRESQTNVIDEHFNKAEHTKLRIAKLYDDNEALRVRKEELEANRGVVEGQLREKEKRHRELKERLWELKHTQERVSEKIERAKEEHGRMKAVLEAKVEETMGVKQEAAKLRPYAQQSPQALENSLRELNATLNADKAQIDALDRRARALQTSADTFATVTADVSTCTRLLTDLSHDLQKEEEEAAKAARHQQALSERSRNVSDVERQERLLQKQLSNILARTEKLRKGAEEKAEKAKERMDELKAVHQQLVSERTSTGREVEERRVRIEQVEKKMADMKENIENEVARAREEYLKMESHIKLYITEMEQNIVDR